MGGGDVHWWDTGSGNDIRYGEDVDIIYNSVITVYCIAFVTFTMTLCVIVVEYLNQPQIAMNILIIVITGDS